MFASGISARNSETQLSRLPVSRAEEIAIRGLLLLALRQREKKSARTAQQALRFY
ncbi:MAG: hypothetical protein MUP61_07650 [Burkholderiales bacterium]|nr:hypothetical protein [Burkholderiales bacterium]